MGKTSKITLVSGPSCAGKSDYIRRSLSDIDVRVVGSQRSAVLAQELKQIKQWPMSCQFFHYNILRAENIRQHSQIRQVRSRRHVPGLVPKLSAFNPSKSLFEHDWAWLKFLKITQAYDLTAVVLIAPHPELLERVYNRSWTEPILRDHTDKYPNTYWLQWLSNETLPALYREWVQELKKRYIDFSVKLSSYGEFAEYSHIEAALEDAGY